MFQRVGEFLQIAGEVHPHAVIPALGLFVEDFAV